MSIKCLKHIFRTLAVTVALLGASHGASAQYYSAGSDPS